MLSDPKFGDRPLTGICVPSVHLHYAPRLPRRIIVDPMAPRDRRQRSTMERPGSRGGGIVTVARQQPCRKLHCLNIAKFFHSARSAAIGSIIAALRAGRIPESTPTAPETATARKTAQNER